MRHKKILYDENSLIDVNLMDWSSICEKDKLTEGFITKYKDYVDWYYISEKQKLSESFIEKYEDYLDWRWIARHQKFSLEFYNKHIDRFLGNTQHLMLRFNYKIQKWYDHSLERF